MLRICFKCCLMYGWLIFPVILKSQQKPDSIPVFELYNIPNVNTRGMEFCPVVYKDQLIFTADREADYLNYGENNYKKNPYFSIQRVEITKTGESPEFSNSGLFSSGLFTKEHNGPITFNKEGDYAVFSRVDKGRGDGTAYRPQLYSAQLIKGQWRNVELLAFNEAEYTYTHPSLSGDGKTLYFVSDKSGGQGGQDIYVSKKTNSGWGKPVNLGREINTGGDEMYPSVHGKGLLIFSSNGRNGLGGLDFYMASLKEDKWTQAVHLDATINSDKDDFGISFNADFKSGYLSSNKEGGKGADDIYGFKVKWLKPEKKNQLAGRFQYSVLSGEKPKKMEVYLVDEEGEIVYTTLTDENGNFIFKNLPPEHSYIVKMEEDDPELVLLLLDDDEKVIAEMARDAKGEFLYRKLSYEDHGKLSMLYAEEAELVDGPARSFTGRFRYKNLQGENTGKIRVYLVDENGKIIYETFTDEKGVFKFENLPFDEHYIVKTKEYDPDLELIVIKDDEMIAELTNNSKGEFVFVRLARDAVKKMGLMQVKDAPIIIMDYSNTMTAQFRYTELEGYPSGMKIVLMDEDLNIITSEVTDKNGKIYLDNLPSDKYFLFKIDETDGSFNAKGIQMDILNALDEMKIVLFKNKEGVFVFRKLGAEGSEDLSLMEEEGGEPLIELPELDHIYFDLNSSQLSKKSVISLNKVVELLKEQTDYKLEVNAYADMRADERYNLWLTEKRAQSIINYLIDKGLEVNRISGKGYGKSNPIVNCVDCTEEQHQLNRRAELKLY